MGIEGPVNLITQWSHQTPINRRKGEAIFVGGGGDTMEPKEIKPTLYKLLIEPVFMTTVGGVGGAVGGRAFGMFLTKLAGCNPGDPKTGRYVRMSARVYSATCAARFGIQSMMVGIRGKDDLTSELVSASGSGVAFSFVGQGLKGQPAHALSHAASFAVFSGTIYKVREAIRARNSQDALYTEARAMLVKLGLEEYEKNFKKGHLTDDTLPLLTDSDLKGVNIPSGERFMILDHIKRYNKMINSK